MKKAKKIMIKRTVKQIAQMAGGTLSNQAFGEEQIHGVTTDTRKYQKVHCLSP
ncbi:hypothetical protein ACEQPO_03455 [Bacillus sp. SL00103]